MSQGDPTSFESIGQASDSVSNAQWWLLFAIMVANKPAEVTTRKLASILNSNGKRSENPFDIISRLSSIGLLRFELEKCKAGQYKRILSAFRTVSDPAQFPGDPRTATLEQLEAVNGIGPKTARWFLLLVHPKAKVAALDTHVLKFLRDQNVLNVPKSTPPGGSRYSSLENVFVGLSDRLGISPRDLDYFVWAVYRQKGRITFAKT